MFLFAGCMGQLDISSIFSGRSDQEPVYETGEANSANNASEIREKLSKIDAVINEYYLNESEIDEEKMIEGIYSGYVAGLGENYTTYYTAQEYADLMESSSGEYSGIGVSVSQSIETGVITIVNPFENGPGYEAGMRKDDILFAVEGEEVTGQDINSVVAKIKGEAGTTVDLTVYRPSTDEYIDMTVERRVVQNPTVTYEMKDGNIGYIQVTEFDEVTVEQFGTAISDLQGQGMQGLVVDLRDNPGGLLSSVCDMLDRILPEGNLLVYTMDKDGNREEHYAEDEDSLDLPMIVLVNGNSASASEIFTAALQDYDKATIMGTTTFGKGIVQVILPLDDGSAVKVTQSQYYTPNGVCIHGEGVTPDIEVEYDASSENDNQLDAALEQMKTMLGES
ncbi:MAG TPA: S41 family peptidase [Candidatus Scybalocola faecigallinarum]|uniref:S41 family peptidase n=1 Tax=Candidatus Scybalocola faecigallinarum TaxID=2840941 RepID=A0A9D1F3N7_9FIRM|nr:S41 family peptidase [Candidatus Scybalocola faecigallinarum]